MERSWFFNQDHIRKNKIYKIEMHILDKQDFHSPRDLNRKEIFEFDDGGREILSYTVQPRDILTYTVLVRNGGRGKKSMNHIAEKNKILSDTLFRFMAYDSSGRKKMSREFSCYSPARTVYVYYFPDGWVREIYCKEWIRMQNGRDVFLLKQEILYSDSFRTEKPSEHFFKKIYFNSDGKVYKEQHFTYEHHLLRSVKDIFVTAPWIEQGTEITYQDQRIRKIRIYAHSGIPQETEYEYQYDESGKLYTILIRKNKYLEKEIGFVNDPLTGDPHSIVIRDYHSQLVQIIRIQIYSAKTPYVEK